MKTFTIFCLLILVVGIAADKGKVQEKAKNQKEVEGVKNKNPQPPNNQPKKAASAPKKAASAPKKANNAPKKPASAPKNPITPPQPPQPPVCAPCAASTYRPVGTTCPTACVPCSTADPSCVAPKAWDAAACSCGCTTTCGVNLYVNPDTCACDCNIGECVNGNAVNLTSCTC